MNELDKYRQLADEFNRIPPSPTRPPTYMEIAGYPHFENVCSNILQFYFNTSAAHGLGNLLLKSLLECIGEHQLASTISSTTAVYREDSTVAGKRIDLVIECPGLIIGIENKLFHWLHNDLQHYSQHIEMKPGGFARRILIVLSLKPESPGAGFINLTYDTLLPVVRQKLLQHSSTITNNYTIYLADFISSIEHLNKPLPMNKEMFGFVADNYESIEKMQKEYRAFLDQLYLVVCAVSDKLPATPANAYKWIWERWVLVHDFEMGNGIVVAVDCAFNFRETTIEIFIRRGEVDKQAYLEGLDYLQRNKGEFNPKKPGFVVYRNESPFYEINTGELAGVLGMVLEGIRIKS